MEADKKSVKLTIRGRTYSLRTEADSCRLEQVERFVNSRLDELEQQSGTKTAVGMTDARLLMLALLNVADECLTYQKNLEAIEEKSENLLASLSAMLDEEVEQLELMAS